MPELNVLYLYYGFKLVVEKIKIEDFHNILFIFKASALWANAF